MNTPAKQVKKIREQQNLNQKKFAHEIGISYSYQRHVEGSTGVYSHRNGEVPIPYLQKIADRFKIPLVLIIKPDQPQQLKTLVSQSEPPTDE